MHFSLALRIALVDRYLLEHFLTDLRLLDHIRSIRKIFFHENVEASSRILDSLFKKVLILLKFICYIMFLDFVNSFSFVSQAISSVLHVIKNLHFC